MMFAKRVETTFRAGSGAGGSEFRVFVSWGAISGDRLSGEFEGGGLGVGSRAGSAGCGERCTTVSTAFVAMAGMGVVWVKPVSGSHLQPGGWTGVLRR